MSSSRQVERITYLVRRLEMVVRANMEEALRPLGVTLHQYTALSVLERRQGLSSAQLARWHFVTPQAMYQMIAAMERDALIKRRPDPANRGVLRAWLTEHGEHVLHAGHRVVDRLEERMLADLEPEQQTALRSALERSLEAVAEVATHRAWSERAADGGSVRPRRWPELVRTTPEASCLGPEDHHDR